ncbi:sulfotransferase [Pseudoalteromonas sp. 68 DY56-GL68]|uniref:tetratricopeptide repeat-containing sulfotransferase family protein n=1 Tax=Pseudoalteromonas sp. 68 DY56-GL68 TaxID=2974919 RepID=UPI00352A3828
MLNDTQQALRAHIQQLLSDKQLNDAHHLLVQRLKQNPEDHVCYFLLSEVNTAAGDINKAIKLLEKALSLASFAVYHLALAKLYVLLGKVSNAAVHYQSALQTADFSAPDFDTLANIATRLGYYDDALSFQKAASQRNKDNLQISYNLAVCYKIHGLFNEAKSLLQQLTTKQPYFYQAHYSQAELNSDVDAKQHIQKLHALANKEKTIIDQQVYFHSLALNYEHLNDYKNAFKYFALSKQAIASKVNYQTTQHRHFCQKLITQSKQQAIESSDSAFSPVFVVGMPRSGTTLVEKILNQSEQIKGIGELNDIAQLIQHATQSVRVIDSKMLDKAYESEKIKTALTSYQQRAEQLSDGLRSCDKQPFNFYYIDFILAAFPNAKIVCMQRDWQDCSIANFRQMYSPQSVFHHYSFTLKDIASYHQDYSALISHFANKYPENVFLQSYEQLVAEPNEQTQKLYAFCDLSWQESCLCFYKNNAASATASKKQIRQPLNKNSIGNWQNYAEFIDADLFQ